MVKILLKKQLAEMHRAFFYDAKKGISRSKGSVVLRFVLFGLLMVAVFAGIFGAVGYMICKPFSALGMGWMFYVIMGFIAIALGAFGSVFNTYSGLYLAKDNDLLLSMPIPVSAIMASRLLGVYLMGLMYSGLVSFSCVIVYFIVNGFSFSALIGGLVYIFFISMVVLILSCLLGWVVAKISLKLKNKSFITVIVSIVGIGLYYFCYYKAQAVLNNLIANAMVYGQEVQQKARILYGFGRMAEGSWLAILVGLVFVGVLFALTWVVLKQSFLKVATGASGASGKGKTGAKREASGAKKVARSTRDARSTSAKPKSVARALLDREFVRFKGSANYMLNCGMGTLMLAVVVLALLIKMDFLKQGLASLGLPLDVIMIFGACAVCLVTSMNDMAEPSVSLEGKNLWILQSLPVKAWEVIKAKLALQLVLTAPLAALCVLVLALVLGFSVLQILLALAMVMGFVFLLAYFDMFLGLKMPNLTWTNELTPIKQSFGVGIAIFAGWIYVAVIVGLYLLLAGSLRGILLFEDGVNSLYEPLYLLVFVIITWALCFVLRAWLKKKGSRVFETL